MAHGLTAVELTSSGAYTLRTAAAEVAGPAATCRLELVYATPKSYLIQILAARGDE